MLHAQLHGKLSLGAAEPERLEDALTSTVLGTAIIAGDVDLIAEWLRGARPVAESQTGVSIENPGVEFECWFWPYLDGVEPDVVLRLGSTLVVIEAKFRSTMMISGIDGGEVEAEEQEELEEVETPAEENPEIRIRQLCEEWSRVQREWSSVGRYHADVARAVGECTPILAYLVDGRRLKEERRKAEESAKQLGGRADIRLLTWQGFDRLLVRRLRRGDPRRWLADVHEYLRRIDLAAFSGFADVISRSIPADRLRGLLLYRSDRRSRWRLTEHSLPRARASLAIVGGWRSGKPFDRWASSAPSLTDSTVVRNWRCQ